MILHNMILYEDGYRVKVNTEKDTIFYFFDYDTRNAGVNMKFQHFHTFYEICILLCPSAVLFIEGIPHKLKEFDIIGVPPNILHKSEYPLGEQCKRLIIQFNLPKYVTGLSNEYEQLLSLFHRDVPIYRFDSQLQEKLFRKLNDIYLLSPKDDPMRDLIIHQKFVEFLTLIFLNQSANTFSDEAKNGLLEEKIYAVARYIHAHYSEELTLDSLAEQFNIGNSYLSHQFCNITGFTVTQYIQMTRIRNVEALLISTQTPITEIAYSCGFNSFSQFNRVFNKHIGMNPRQYRKQNQFQRSEFD